MGYYNHREHKKTRRLIRETAQMMEEIIMTNQERVDAGLANVSGDVTRLTDSLAAAREEIRQILADQDVEVANRVDAALGTVADQLEELGGRTPEDEQPEEPAEPPAEEV